jgi:ubiquinone/menaquinone biosynthesis C-methylase UbiE
MECGVSDHDSQIGLLEQIRRAEIATIRPYLPPGGRVLEIGGGSGFQASLLASWGHQVTAVDLAERPRRRQLYFPVQNYDGRRFPFPDATFDVVFSSNVLEHVLDLQALLCDANRVLVPTGREIHIIPTSLWRMWTCFSHYAYLLKYIFGSREIATAEVMPDASAIVRRQGLRYLLRRALIPGPHGAYSNAFEEILCYRKERWIREFAECGLVPELILSTKLFYTGHSLVPRLSIEARTELAKILGSSCLMYVLRRSAIN